MRRPRNPGARGGWRWDLNALVPRFLDVFLLRVCSEFLGAVLSFTGSLLLLLLSLSLSLLWSIDVHVYIFNINIFVVVVIVVAAAAPLESITTGREFEDNIYSL